MNDFATAQSFRPERFDEPAAAVARLHAIYDASTARLREAFRAYVGGQAGPRGGPSVRIRACYPQVSISVSGFGRKDTLLSYGFVDRPGTFSTTVTRPDLFHGYLIEQIDLLLRNHRVPVEV